MAMAKYHETLTELQAVLQSLEQDSVSIDELGTKLEHGFQLLESLRGLLTGVETRVEEILSARQDKPQQP